MGEQWKFDQKWDFRRKENSFDDSSSENSGSDSSHEPILKKHKNDSQAETTEKSAATTTARVRRKQPARSQKSRSKKDQNKPGKGKKTGGAVKKTPQGKGEGQKAKKKKEEEGGSEAGESVMDSVGTFMEILLGDLKASRESLFDWMQSEMCQSDDKEKTGANQVRKRAQLQRPKRMVRKKKNSVPECEKDNKPHVEEENPGAEQSKAEDKAAEKNNVEEETENAPGEAQHQSNMGFDCNVGPLERLIRSKEAGHGRNYFQQQQKEEKQGGDHRQFTRRVVSGVNVMEKPKYVASTSTLNKNSLVLGIPAQNSGLGMPERHSRGKRPVGTNAIVNMSAGVQPRGVSGAETQKDLISVTPIDPNLSSALLLPAGSSLNSLFPSNQGLASFSSNNFQPRPVPQVQDPSEIQPGSGFARQGLRNLSGLSPINGYFPNFPVPFHHGFNFQTQPSSESSLRENNLLGGLTMSGGAIRFSGGGLPEPFSSGGDAGNSLSDYRANSGRQTPFQTQNNVGGDGSMFQN